MQGESAPPGTASSEGAALTAAPRQPGESQAAEQIAPQARCHTIPLPVRGEENLANSLLTGVHCYNTRENVYCQMTASQAT